MQQILYLVAINKTSLLEYFSPSRSAQNVFILFGNISKRICVIRNVLGGVEVEGSNDQCLLVSSFDEKNIT